MGLIDGADRYIFGWGADCERYWQEHDAFGRYLAVGRDSDDRGQAFFDISVGLMLPNKGIRLLLISYGGSSLFVMLASVGVLLNVSQQTE